MQTQDELIRAEAKSITVDQRKRLLEKKSETELHELLKRLFEAMDPEAEVVITHGPNEFGKDIVIIKEDPFGEIARAVVVKKGRIKGDANGPIDVVKSQVDMCFKHPYSPDGKNEVRIAEVIVAASGNITNNAKERIEKEFESDAIRFYDSSKLVDLFTEHYPRVFVGGLECDFLDDGIGKLDRIDLFNGKSVSLSHLFVEPALRRLSVSSGNEGSFYAKRQEVAFKDLSGLIKAKKMIAIVGEAGSGKTTLLKKLAIDSMRSSRSAFIQDQESKRGISVLVKAGDFSKQTGWDGEMDSMQDYLGLPGLISVDTILVDGLDEVGSDFRKSLIKKLSMLVKQSGVAVAVTSRCEDYFETTEWHTYEVKQMSVRQAISLCEKIVTDDIVANSLKAGIRDIKQRISLTPLAVFLLLEIIKERQEVPASLTELYDQYIDNVLGKFDKDKGIESLFEYEMKKRFLAELADRHFVGKLADAITRADFESFGRGFFADYEWPWKDWPSLQDELKRSNLICEDDLSGCITFKHRSFLEFFAAYGLYVDAHGDKVSTDKAIDYYFDPLWSDVSFYYFGLKKSMSIETIDQIIESSGDEPYDLVQKMRLGRLLQACWHSKAKVKRHGLVKSSLYAYRIRESLLADMLKEDPDVSPIFADFFLISLASDSYKSVFLRDQAEALLFDNEFNDDASLLGALCIYSGIASCFDVESRSIISEKLMNDLNENKDRELEGRGLFYLLVAAGNGDDVAKQVKRRLKKYLRRYSSVMKGLLPEAKLSKA